VQKCSKALKLLDAYRNKGRSKANLLTVKVFWEKLVYGRVRKPTKPKASWNLMVVLKMLTV
jgi:hypothetical protein